MAGGLLLQPSYAQDIKYPAYQDRLLMKSLGVQAGVVGLEDFIVTAGTGLQVEVEKGKGFIEQTNQNQEVGNTFYNGLYNVLGPTKQNPYNSVEIPTTNPQIAQIILRVYDVNELLISGSTYARIEWLNGTANTGATKAHAEEGKASEFGAAALPASSYRVAYVVVPKNATTSSEYSIIDARGFSVGVPFPKFIQRKENKVIAKSGEFIQATEPSQVIELPKGSTAGKIIGVYCQSEELEIKSESIIVGDFTNSKTMKLTQYQHVLLQGGSGSAGWYIISGEPKREQKYSASTARSLSTPYEPSPTRPVAVILTIRNETGGGSIKVSVGGNQLYNPSIAVTQEIQVSFKVNPGQKWEITKFSGSL